MVYAIAAFAIGLAIGSTMSFIFMTKKTVGTLKVQFLEVDEPPNLLLELKESPNHLTNNKIVKLYVKTENISYYVARPSQK